MNKDQAKEEIKKLIEKYEQIKSSGKIKTYTEESTKKDFILPLFKALGWKVDEDEVSAEEYIISSGRVDYGFYINGRPKFYLEAKPLKADLNLEEFAKQAIRYSFNRGVTWAVLTDFEGIKVFNAQALSDYLGDKLYFEINYSDYLNRFDQLWLLSKESLLNDLIDTEAERVGKKLQRIPIAETLAKDLERSREILIGDLSKWNDNIDQDILEEGVQKILDRLVFLRVVEDRKIEPPILKSMVNQWENSSKKTSLYRSMIDEFRKLDEFYNSNLFSKNVSEEWDEYSDAVKKVIKILYGKEGYYEYDFSVMPADVLGNVYENYLGYKLSQSKKGPVLDKSVSKSKRKEQGIYYTPPFIVDYIVRNALKPVLDKCKSVNDLKKIKVLDPACGSGSFLIKALEVILEKYEDFNYKDDENLRIEIILENIFGVDLDEQAVEIARLNLLINALKERGKLPSLENNIKNGNSLISGTDEVLVKYFGKNFRDKKPFNWQEKFPEVFKQGGFDVIIGNPPYVNLANIKDSSEREFLKNKFVTAKNKSDLYSFFTEKAINLLKDKGFLGFIFSNSWLSTDSFSKFREFLIKETTVTKLVKLPSDIFHDATVTTILLFLEKQKAPENHVIDLFEAKNNSFIKLGNTLSYERIKAGPNFSFSFNSEIIIKIPTVLLGSIAKFSLGIKTSNDERFILNDKKDNDTYKMLRGKDIQRYSFNWAGKWLWYKPDLMVEKVGAGPRKLNHFLKSKLIIKDVAKDVCATLDKEDYLTNDTLSLIYELEDYDFLFVLGLLNSNFIKKWYKVNFPSGLHIKINQLSYLPIPKFDLTKLEDKTKQDKLVTIVNQILILNKKLLITPENSNQWNSIKEEIEEIDKRIDEEVYKLYDLTPEEIKIVENY